MRSIDIHAHITPQCFWKATEGGGSWHTLRREQDARGRQIAVIGGHRSSLPPKARWTPEERLADMDSLGVDVHVLSPTPVFITMNWTLLLLSPPPETPTTRYTR
jgi:hypothetical protein